MKKSLITISAFVIVAFGLSFCTNTNASDKDTSPEKSYSETITSSTEGKELLDSKCMVCHKIQDSQKAMLAPPFAYIKKKYSKVNSSKEDFVQAFVNFAVNPKEDDAMMFGALKQFKVMPNMGYEKGDMEKIANYIYENEFPEPIWCNK